MLGVAVCLALLFRSVKGYEWSCNHYDSWTTDICYRYSTSTEYLFKCNDTDSIDWYEYNAGECGVEGSVPTHVYTKKKSSSHNFQCDQKKACDYSKVSYYQDDECSGSYYDWKNYIVGECYSYTSLLSYKYECDGSELKTTTFWGANCTGSSVTTVTNYDDNYSGSYQGCYKLSCKTEEESSKSEDEDPRWWVVAAGAAGIVLVGVLVVITAKRKKLKKKKRNRGERLNAEPAEEENGAAPVPDPIEMVAQAQVNAVLMHQANRSRSQSLQAFASVPFIGESAASSSGASSAPNGGENSQNV